MRTKFILPVFIFISYALFSQKTIDVKGITGTALISGDVSPNQAKLLALNEAKVSALKAAGIDEHINSYQMLFTSSIKNDFEQFFSSDIQSELQGAVKSYKINSEKTYCKSEKEIVCEVTIDATVVKYDTKPDVAFNANIEGIKGVYNSGQNLSFNLKTTQNCYLTIFNITDTEANLLYPNSYEKQIKLEKMDIYKFPTIAIDYSLGNEKKKEETNRLIMVFTKSQIPFIKMDKDQVTTNENIFTWIYSIPPDQRHVEYFNLTILK